MTEQFALFASSFPEPEGLQYAAEFVSPATEQELIGRIAALPLQPFQFGQYEGKRRVAWFGFQYDYALRRLQDAEPIPDWLGPIIEQVEAFGGPGTRIGQVLCTEYDVGSRHRLAPRQTSLRQGVRPVLGIGVQVQVPAACRREMGALYAQCRTAVALPDVGRFPACLGAQHSGR